MDRAPIEEKPLPQTVIEGYELFRTCTACPEQYDVMRDGVQVGYLRLRHGYFRADYPDCGGETVFAAEPRGDGIFEPEEREFFLRAAIAALDARVRRGPSNAPSE